jgi:hypothetical protein
MLTVAALALGLQMRSTMAMAAFVTLEPASTPAGYLARLLINENPFPGERGYTSVEDSKIGMHQVLWVLHGRMHYIPDGYTQVQIATVRTTNILDVITAPGQCEGFSRNAAGQPVAAARVEERLAYLTRIANSGGKPGKFAELLNYGQDLARVYMTGGIEAADRFAGLNAVNQIAVTGRAYSWMTNKDYYNPGGDYVSIPDAQGGSPGGNRFYTLRKDPK